MRSLVAPPRSALDSPYARHVNPQWVRLLDVHGMNVDYVRCEGAELFTADGRRILDFLSGYCVHNVGHNHPRVVAALKDELDRQGPAMLQSHVPELAGELAARLCAKAGGPPHQGVLRELRQRGHRDGHQVRPRPHRAARHPLRRGRLPRAHLRRAVADGATLLDRGLRPAAADTAAVPFGDLDALGESSRPSGSRPSWWSRCRPRRHPRARSAEYLEAAQALCRRYGTLFVLDEVQTGLYRTGPSSPPTTSGSIPTWWCSRRR